MFEFLSTYYLRVSPALPLQQSAREALMCSSIFFLSFLFFFLSLRLRVASGQMRVKGSGPGSCFCRSYWLSDRLRRRKMTQQELCCHLCHSLLLIVTNIGPVDNIHTLNP